jgi:DNA polymerase III epsilon subunit-like protein
MNRHNAVADACATAQLLLIMLARAQARRLRSSADLRALEEEQRWLARAQRP